MKKKFSFVAIFFIAGIILAAFVSVNAFKEAYRSREIEKEVESMKQEAQRIQNENTAIQHGIEFLGTSNYVEKVSKDKMNMQKPDENVVVVNPGITQQSQPSIKQNEVSRVDTGTESNYIKWWNFFFKYN